jgi:hypothetical protein
MAFAFRHQFGRAVQALFGLDHVAGGEAILAASVLAKLDQIGRTAHRAHDLVELVDAVAVPVREHRHVAAREGRLLMRDRVQRHRWIGDDRAPLLRAISRCMSARSAASIPSPSIRCAVRRSGFAAPARCPAPQGCDGRSARRCRVRPAAR